VGSNLPIVLIEIVLVFGGVLAFGWWQLRSIEQDREAARRQRESAKAEAEVARDEPPPPG
jgi:predicted negative regulator of RcsB-dependent stress response